MAITFQSHVVSDLCLGKPALKSLSLSSSIGDALFALKSSDDDSFLSIWTCNHPLRHHIPSPPPPPASDNKEGDLIDCRCVGKISMVDILCFLCKHDNSSSPVSALQSPVSLLLPKSPSPLVKHVHPSTSLLEAIGLILQGAQNLIVPIETPNAGYPRRKHQKPISGGQEYCWLTQEDLLRFILSRIGLFTPISSHSIQDLAIIQSQIPAVDYDSPASLALDALSASKTPVAVIDDGALVGEISPSAFSGADESASAAIMALSCGDLMTYIESWGGPPEYLVRAIKSRLKDSESEGLLALLDFDDNLSCRFSSSSSDDEDSSPLGRSRRHSRSGSYSSRMGRRAEEITCHPRSSLVAVMVQAIAHRASYVWVVDENCGLVGIVTFSDMLEVFYEDMKCVFEEEFGVTEE